MEKELRETYKQRILSLKDVSINEYLHFGFNLYKESILKSMEYFKTCMPYPFKQILLNKDFWALYYNKPMEELFIKEFDIKNEEEKKAIGNFIYTFQCDRREFNEQEDKEKLRTEYLNKGFKEFEFLTYLPNELNKDFDKRCFNYYNPLNNLKVLCLFELDKMGLLGSFSQMEEHKGKLIYISGRGLFFMPKKHTKTGQLIRSKFYYKEI